MFIDFTDFTAYLISCSKSLILCRDQLLIIIFTDFSVLSLISCSKPAHREKGCGPPSGVTYLMRSHVIRCKPLFNHNFFLNRGPPIWESGRPSEPDSWPTRSQRPAARRPAAPGCLPGSGSEGRPPRNHKDHFRPWDMRGACAIMARAATDAAARRGGGIQRSYYIIIACTLFRWFVFVHDYCD